MDQDSSLKAAVDPRGVIPIRNPQKSSHATPPEGCHGLTLPNPARAAFIGGVSSGKTNALICAAGHCHSHYLSHSLS